MSVLEKYGSYTHSITEECKHHPVDYPTCKNEKGCQIKKDMRKHGDIIKRCRFYDKKGEGKT